MTVSVLCLFVMAWWAGLQCAIVAFPGQTQLHLYVKIFIKIYCVSPKKYLFRNLCSAKR